SDSIIYKYFKGKEDIVFSIPGERKDDFLSLLDSHLQGIEDAESRLRKTIWFYLWYCESNPQYAKILYFDCFSSADFYQTPGYELIRGYAKILVRCMEEGVKQGIFRPDVDLHLVRDMVLGLMGCEMISFLASKEIDVVVPDLDAIMFLTLGILTFPLNLEEFKADRILNAAEKVFAENGFYKTRVAEIAKLAEVAEGTVYEYFGSKENLLLSISNRHFRKVIHDLPEVFEIKNPVRKLRRFTEYYFSAFSSKRDFLKVFLIQIQLARNFYLTKQIDFFASFLTAIEQIVEEGVSAGYFRKEVNPRVFRNMFIGTFNNLALRWFVLHGNRYIDMMQKIDEVKKLLSLAVLDPSSSLDEIKDTVNK
ncbi:MAG TPA: TetR/AcrR family transcriptional regulator C-terminal domain-containing protein, partial [Smithellaceae bacterium]|nr:TetR/AcrR family transcriptional regulator C-terminal domain-containing protein [Smithellaceae bacterium]